MKYKYIEDRCIDMVKLSDTEQEQKYIPGERLQNGIYKLPRIKVGTRWFWIDERLKQYRSVDDPIVFIEYQNMDDIIELENVLIDSVIAGFSPKNKKHKKILNVLQSAFDNAIFGDMEGVEKIKAKNTKILQDAQILLEIDSSDKACLDSGFWGD